MAIKKKEFNYKEKFSSKTKYKPEDFYYCGEAFSGAVGLPGPVMGGITMFLGHSNTGKTNALILAAANAQKRGHLPVIIMTEKKWNWKHAVDLGLDAKQNEDGEWDGEFIYNDSFKYIEQITDFINDVIDAQEKGDIDKSVLFLWDSVGSVPCLMTYQGKGGRMHNAAVLADKIGMGIHSRISESKKESYPYYNSLVVVNQPWVEPADNPFEQPEIKAKGGNAVWLSASLVFLFGKQKKAGVSQLDAVKDGRKVGYATRTRISVLKNHVNGIAYKDGKVIATPHNFIPDTKEAIDKYKKEYSEYWSSIIGGSGEYSVVESDIDIEDED